MNLIPVIDIASGRVVHAIGGQREAYAPLQSAIVDSDDPCLVATAMCQAIQSDQLYVADIGAYQGRSRDWNALKLLGAVCKELNVEMLIDFGIINSIDAISAFELLDQTIVANFKLIVALESMEEMIELEMVTQEFGARTIFSLDFHGGELKFGDETISNLEPSEVVRTVVGAGIQELIVLDTADVGGNDGCSTIELLQQIHKDHPALRLIGGGGIRTLADAEQLASTGCNAVLVATAVHHGAIKKS